VTTAALRSEAAITAETLVWRRGMGEWTRADAVAELASVIKKP
jgi:hypothetical protein